jgi:hypothetical protein
MKKTISLKIDVTKIDKSRLFKGEKGTYLDAILLFDDQEDKYKNNGMIVESVSKEEKDNGVKGNILGNAKVLWSEDVKPPVNDPMDASDSSLPF